MENSKTIIDLLGMTPSKKNASGDELLAKRSEIFALLTDKLKSEFSDDELAKMQSAKAKQIKAKKVIEAKQKEAIKNLQIDNLRAKVVLYRTIEHENGKTSNLTIAEFEPKLDNVVGTYVKKTVAMNIEVDGEISKSTNQHAEFRSWNQIEADATKKGIDTEVSIDLVVRCAKSGLFKTRQLPSIYKEYLQGLKEGKATTFSTKAQRDSAKCEKHKKADKLQTNVQLNK